MKNYKIDVWYRYASCGEIEKDFDTHNIIAKNEIEAITLARGLYPNRAKIPFKINLTKKWKIQQ